MSPQRWLTTVLFATFRATSFVLIKPSSLGRGNEASTIAARYRPAKEEIPENHDNSLYLKVSFDGQRLQRKRESPESIIKTHLSKLYGKVAANRTVVQASNELANGSHAIGLVMQVFCCLESEDQRMPLRQHPREMCFSLNRMCYETMQVKAYAYGTSSCCFQPRKFETASYLYRISVGKRRDPIQKDRVWHLPIGSAPTLERMQAACHVLKNKTPSLHDMWCQQATDTWSNDTVAYDIHVVSRDHTLNVLDCIATIVDQPVAPPHGLVLTDVQYDVPIYWHEALS